MEDGGIQIRDPLEPISRLADLAGSERDRGWEAVQNRYPVAMKPPAGRNAADLSAASTQRPLGGWQGHERLAGLEASSVALDVAAMSLVFQKIAQLGSTDVHLPGRGVAKD